MAGLSCNTKQAVFGVPTSDPMCKKAIAELEFKKGSFKLRILAKDLEIQHSGDDLTVRSIVCNLTVWLAVLDGERLRVFSSDISESKCREQTILSLDEKCCFGFDIVAVNNIPHLLFHSKTAVALFNFKDMTNSSHEFNNAEITHASFNLDASLISLAVAGDFSQLSSGSFDKVLQLDGLAPADAQIFHANCSGLEYIVAVLPNGISCLDLTSKKNVRLLDEDITSFTFTGEVILFSDVHGRVSTYQLDMLIQTALRRDSSSVNNLTEPFYESDMAISENGMLYTIQAASSGIVNIWNLHDGGKHVQTIEKAANIGDITDNSEVWVSKDGSEFVVLSSTRALLAWWSVSDPALPEFHHHQAIRHWHSAEIAWSSDLECTVFRSSEDNLLYLTERGKEYVSEPAGQPATLDSIEDDAEEMGNFFDIDEPPTNLSSSQYSILPATFRDGSDSASVAMTFGRLKDTGGLRLLT
ncbi:hypothetical protein BJ741DRAFT_655143 [Chytriomyces cf. hyalinus JEL632]|nr:hypothetical protein BJ741DRAFT_655143 [Chytriomyces cf. hyalinus JEL632]